MTSPRRSPPTCAPAALATHRPPTEKIGPTSTHGAGLAGLPAAPETVGHYLTARAGRLAVVTLGRRLAAVIAAHQ